MATADATDFEAALVYDKMGVGRTKLGVSSGRLLVCTHFTHSSQDFTDSWLAHSRVQVIIISTTVETGQGYLHLQLF